MLTGTEDTCVFNDTATTEIYTLSLHDALPISRKALKKCRIYKSFHFSLHGWMNFHAALVEVADGKVTSNASGHHVAKILKKVLYDTRGKRS